MTESSTESGWQGGRALSFATGFVFAFRVAITFLFFQSDPQSGTAVTVALSFGLAIAAVGVFLMTSAPEIRQSVDGYLRKPRTSPYALCTQKWLVVYLALSITSLLWTTTKSIMVAAAYSATTAADVLATFLIIRNGSPEKQVARVMKGFVTGTGFVCLFAWLAPPMEDLRLGNEDFLHPNALGFEIAIATFFAMYLSSFHKRWRWVAVCLGITLLRTLSKASIIAFVVAAVYYLLRGAKIRRKAKVQLGIAANLVVIAFWGLLEAYLNLYMEGTQAETLTGRTYIWAQSFDIAMDKPWLGHGFYSFRWVFPQFIEFEAWHAHNEILQQFFSYGIVGVLIVIGLYCAFARQITASAGTQLKATAASLLIFAIMRGLVDTERFDLSLPLWTMIMLSAALPPRESEASPTSGFGS